MLEEISRKHYGKELLSLIVRTSLRAKRMALQMGSHEQDRFRNELKMSFLYYGWVVIIICRRLSCTLSFLVFSQIY